MSDYSFLNHVFHVGEVVFNGSAYDAKDGLTRYWFRGVTSDETNAWHAFEQESTDAKLIEAFHLINAA